MPKPTNCKLPYFNSKMKTQWIFYREIVLRNSRQKWELKKFFHARFTKVRSSLAITLVIRRCSKQFAASLLLVLQNMRLVGERGGKEFPKWDFYGNGDLSVFWISHFVFLSSGPTTITSAFGPTVVSKFIDRIKSIYTFSIFSLHKNSENDF